MATVAYPGTPGTVIYGGLPTPSGGTALTTITLANTSATEQSAGFVSPMFGLPLKQGDVPAGQYPQFTLADDTPVPATIHSVTSWPDGSMKWCGVFLRVPAAVPGSGTLAITVKNGGSAPGSSARAVSDLTAANLSVELTGVTNLTGTWTASLNDAITNGTVVVIGDGPAGMLVRILGDFKQSGGAHGQLVNWHYALIAQNASGGLLGLRYLGRGAQPWTNVTSPAPAKREFTAALKSGATTLRSLQGTQAGETLSSTITMPHYTDFYTCGPDGRWDFVQGGGSASADCTVRVQYDKTYFTKTKLVPPFDLSVSPSSLTAASYNPQCLGSCQERNLDATGERYEIGVMPSWSVRHLLTQSAADERNVRVNGLAAGGWRTCLRKSTTKQIIPRYDFSASYDGLGPAMPNARYSSAEWSVDVNARPDTHLWLADYDIAHRPAIEYYAYLITGEPQYLDMLVEQVACTTITGPTGTTGWKVGSPITGGDPTTGYGGFSGASINGTTYKAAGLIFNDNLFRIQAWTTRDLADLCAIYPDVCPSGTATKAYFKQALQSCYQALAAYNNALPLSWRDAGLVSFIGNSTNNDTTFESPWAIGYWSNAVCHAANVVPEVSELAAFRQHLAKFYSSQNAISDIACIAAYRFSQWDGGAARVEKASDLVFSISGSLTWSSTTSEFTTTDAWSPTNGDVFAFSTKLGGGANPFPAINQQTRLYVVNASGKSFQLASTPGGSPIAVPANGSATGWFCRLQNAGTLFSFEQVGGNTSMVVSLGAAIRHHEACGDSVVSLARTAQDANVAQAGPTFAAEPKYAMAVAYPG